MKHIFPFFLSFFCITCSFVLPAQSSRIQDKSDSKVIFELNAQWGKILKHTPKFIPDITEISSQHEFSVSFRTFGSLAWERKAKYPEWGVSFFHSRYGDRQIFGQAYALFHHVKFWIWRHRVLDMYFRIGSGLAYLNKPYDIIHNPDNNVIGSHINNITQARVGLDIHITSRLDITAGAAFTHYSNSRAQSPNLGINVASGVIGLRYAPFKTSYFYSDEEIPKPAKRNHYSYRFSVGVNDWGVGGPKYPIYLHTFTYARQTSVFNRFWTGITYAFNQGEYDFMLIQEISPEKKRIWRTSDLSIFIGDELVFSNLGIFFLVGAYLADPEFNSAPVYAKVGANYYFYEFGAYHHQLFVGINLKSHYSQAEFLEIGGGIAF